MNIRLRWKKNPAPTGLMAVGSGPRGSKLHDGEKKYASVCADRQERWYWVAGWDSDVPYMNTCDSSVATEDEAKSQALAYVKKHLS